MQVLQPLVDLVSRVPTRVQVKLMAAFLAIVVLLIVLGAVGLEVLSGVNQRTDELNKLQRKIEAYRQVQHDITSQLYSVSSAFLSPDDVTLSSTLRQLNQFGYNIDRLQFVAKDEVELLDRFRQDHERFTSLVTQVVELIRAGRVSKARELQLVHAVPLADRLGRLTNQLVNRAETDMVTGIELSNQAYVTSQWIVVGFASGSIVLALMLGYVISLSLIGPVTEVGARLDQIAAGDFSQRVDVVNRDELGALAANVNRMSEELGHLYQQLEAANLAKSRFLAAASHDLRQPLHALNWFVTQLRSEKDQAEKARLIEQINTATGAMNELFNALLDISKLRRRREREGCACGSYPVMPGSAATSSCSNGSSSIWSPTLCATRSRVESWLAAAAALVTFVSMSGTPALAFRRISAKTSSENSTALGRPSRIAVMASVWDLRSSTGYVAF